MTGQLAEGVQNVAARTALWQLDRALSARLVTRPIRRIRRGGGQDTILETIFPCLLQSLAIAYCAF